MLGFLAIAFGVAWACQIPVYALELDGPLAYALLVVGAIAPSVAGVIASRRAVWRDLRHGPRPIWALAVGLLYPSVIAATAGLVGGGLTIGMPYFGSVLVPPIGEELGWRGYMQPRLADRWGTLRASLVVGVVWGVWHAPTAIGHLETVPLFVLSVVLTSVVIGFLWERSGRSLWACVAAHTGINLGIVHGPRTETLVVLAAVVSAIFVAHALRRSAVPGGRLGIDGDPGPGPDHRGDPAGADPGRVPGGAAAGGNP
jgi:uncharacterized protein